MQATRATRNQKRELILVNTLGLQEILSCGRPSAVDVGTKAGARVQFGRTVKWNVRKVQEYIDSISE